MADDKNNQQGDQNRDQNRGGGYNRNRGGRDRGGRGHQEDRPPAGPKNPCPGCGADRPVGATICAHCGHGVVKYKLVAIPVVGKDSYYVNLTVYRGEGNKPAIGVAARVDVLDEGQAPKFADIPKEGKTIQLPFKGKSRTVTFSVQYVTEDGIKINPDVDTTPLTLAAKTIHKKIVEPPIDTLKGFLGNFLTGWNAGRGK